MGRLLFVGSLAFAQWFDRDVVNGCTPAVIIHPFVSVIVPAYNEELVVENTIRSLLASDYTEFEIVVVDDGSQDNTSQVVNDNFGDDERVKLLTVTNGGKAAALNTGSHTLGVRSSWRSMPTRCSRRKRSARWPIGFYDKPLGAIAGNAKVGNRINIVTRWQALEYITSQNMDRRAFASLELHYGGSRRSRCVAQGPAGRESVGFRQTH